MVPPGLQELIDLRERTRGHKLITSRSYSVLTQINPARWGTALPAAGRSVVTADRVFCLRIASERHSGGFEHESDLRSD
jgi:hypothetical protein